MIYLPSLLLPLTVIVAVYPDGRLPSRAWRVPVIALAVGLTVVTVGASLSAGAYDDIAPGPPPTGTARGGGDVGPVRGVRGVDRGWDRGDLGDDRDAPGPGHVTAAGAVGLVCGQRAGRVPADPGGGPAAVADPARWFVDPAGDRGRGAALPDARHRAAPGAGVRVSDGGGGGGVRRGQCPGRFGDGSRSDARGDRRWAGRRRADPGPGSGATRGRPVRVRGSPGPDARGGVPGRSGGVRGPGLAARRGVLASVAESVRAPGASVTGPTGQQLAVVRGGARHGRDPPAGGRR